MAEVKLGTLITVQNKNKQNLQNQRYIALQVEDFTGQNETCILFTEIQLADMEKIQAAWLMDSLIFGRIYPITINKRQTNMIKVNNNGIIHILRVSNTQLNRAKNRALKNPEDLTKKSMLTDLFD